MKLTISLNPNLDMSKRDPLCGVLDLKFSRIHLAWVIVKFYVVYGHYSIYVPVSRLNRDANCFIPVDSKDCMTFDSYEYRKMSTE